MAAVRDALREEDRKRLERAEELDREVEANRGARPLEGFAGGHTTWTEEQDDKSAPEVYDLTLRQNLMQLPEARNT
jgi:hypothetical protein